MAERYRFLSVVLKNPAGPHSLVLECEDGQWWMYYYSSKKEIQTALPFRDLETAQNHAFAELGVRPVEWIEDSNQ